MFCQIVYFMTEGKLQKLRTNNKTIILIEADGCVKGNLLNILLNVLVCKFETSFGFQRILVAKMTIWMTNGKAH